MYNKQPFYLSVFFRRSLIPILALLLLMVPRTMRADDTPVLNDSSYYEISTAAQLKWFSDKVAAGDRSINGVLTADIDLSTLGAEYWQPIGLWGESSDGGSMAMAYYTGKFNGQGHTVSGLVLRKTMCSGLFGYAKGATISNITVSNAQMKVTPDSYVSSMQYGIGTICGLAEEGTVIDNCHSTKTEILYKPYNAASQRDINSVGGIVGEIRSSSVVKNCTVDGFVRTEGVYVGGIAGAVNFGKVINCHLKDYATDTDTDHSAVVGINHVGGIAGYLQNRTIAQAIVDCTVADETVINATNGTSGTVCGTDTMLAEPGKADGHYEIYTAEHLKWFASQVSGGNTKINALLMNNLNMSKAGSFSPIGNKSNPFAGEFNGQEYTIDSLTIASQAYAGLFGHVKDGRVLNVNLTNPSLDASNNNYQGFIVGWLTQNSGNSTCMSYIKNCNVSNGNLYRNVKGEP